MDMSGGGLLSAGQRRLLAHTSDPRSAPGERLYRTVLASAGIVVCGLAILVGQAAIAAVLLYFLCAQMIRWHSVQLRGRYYSLICAVLLAASMIAGGATVTDAVVALAVVLLGGEWTGALRKAYTEECNAANIDRLTEALTPRGFCQVLELELQAARREARPVGLVFLDLDHFKVINDRHGHDAGDLVLKELADRLRQNLLSDDHIARLGGDEFVVFLRHIEGDGAVERFRRLLKHTVEGMHFGLTASVGGLIVRPDQIASPAEIIARADKLMYQVKHSGKADVIFEDLRVASDAQAA